MELSSQLVWAVLLGMVLLMVILAFGLVIVRALAPKPPGGAPLVAEADGKFHVMGRRVSCAHCDGSTFHANQILLNTWLLSLLRIDWLDSSATVLTCEQCGKLTWFTQESPNDGD